MLAGYFSSSLGPGALHASDDEGRDAPGRYGGTSCGRWEGAERPPFKVRALVSRQRKARGSRMKSDGEVMRARAAAWTTGMMCSYMPVRTLQGREGAWGPKTIADGAPVPSAMRAPLRDASTLGVGGAEELPRRYDTKVAPVPAVVTHERARRSLSDARPPENRRPPSPVAGATPAPTRVDSVPDQ
jgi:hypothetical protein